MIAHEHYLRVVSGLVTAPPEKISQCQNELDDFVLQNPNYKVPEEFIQLFPISCAKEAWNERAE
ncbi:MAG TPA: hypothetical protein PKA10_05430 [Selenomonadales bacterium]|nr:hypothetical protein [Selenomonadales bacterium]